MKTAACSSPPDGATPLIAADRMASSTVDFAPVLQRIARRADELAATAPGRASDGEARRLWIKAEHEILGADSRIALADLLRLTASLNPR